MQNPQANFIGVFSLIRDDLGFQVNPLCRHDTTSPFPPSGNGGYLRNLDVILDVIRTFISISICGCNLLFSLEYNSCVDKVCSEYV